MSSFANGAAYGNARGRVRTRLVFDSNGQGISMAKTDPVFRDSFAHADIVHADGQVIVAVSLGDQCRLRETVDADVSPPQHRGENTSARPCGCRMQGSSGFTA